MVCPAPSSSPTAALPVTLATGAGTLRGRRVDGVDAYLGVPYARPPVGELRFAAPRGRTAPFVDHDATRPSPAVPQPPSRLAALMGDPGGTQDEAGSLTLNVWAPVGARDLPVLLWLHGGALLSGSASWPWYDGARLAASQDVVVVTASYRLGALGYLDLRGTAAADDSISPNNGLLDQMTALEWVVDHIADFGGDPARITLGGQSSGAESAALLAGSPRTGPHVRRLLLQSGGAHGWVQSEEAASAVAEEYLAVLAERHGAEARTAAGLRSLPTRALLDAQVDLLGRRAARRLTDPPFGVATASDVPLGGTRSFLAARPDLPILAGWTRDELLGFVSLDPSAGAMTEEVALGALTARFGDRAGDLLRHYRAARPDAGPAALVAAISGDAVMMAPALDLARSRVEAGAPVFLYRFDWSRSPAGACHCVDLPFTFGSLDAWPDAAMLGPGDRTALEPLAGRLMGAVGSFVRSGRPAATDVEPAWPDWSRDETVALLDTDGPAVAAGLGRVERDLLASAMPAS
ncbi:carboxylesterase family protein [Nocardioides sp. QY071]|uniref:carboxylesterase/lipase family protein n=1 Tax=Nocardioides sp. QY071 TaxID=3044187 RepID=UPI002499AE8C|nr:carboxylesterase family protein [Nocardioides sp. QY071]WGY00389.1 carboxylesterase family protein [Nocardioides sp. QY071]